MYDELENIRFREERCAETLQGRALLVIDYILSNIADSDDELLGTLYQIAHCATGVCGNPHLDWVEELEKAYKELCF